MARIEVVHCSVPHKLEVIETIPAEGDVYPGDGWIAWQSRAGCQAQFTSFIGISG